MSSADPLHVGVLTGDPELPYAYNLDGRFGPADLEALRHAIAAVDALDGYRAEAFSNHAELFDRLRAAPPALALNLCDTGYRNLQQNQPNVPALLELLEIPYTGATSAAIALARDKALVRLLALQRSIPVPNERFVDLSTDPLPLPELYPAIIKPNEGYGSLSITPDSVVHSDAEADVCLRRLAAESVTPHRWALIQDFLTGPEYTLGLVGNPRQGFTVLPILEIDYSALDPSLPPILSYGSKMDPESPYWQAVSFRRAELDTPIRAAMVEHSTWLFERLGLRDFARIDFRAGADGVPRLLDANASPTWAHDGKMAIMAGWAGYEYSELLRLILEAARARYGL